jgi:hypothetical protein
MLGSRGIIPAQLVDGDRAGAARFSVDGLRVVACLAEGSEIDFVARDYDYGIAEIDGLIVMSHVHHGIIPQEYFAV